MGLVGARHNLHRRSSLGRRLARRAGLIVVFVVLAASTSGCTRNSVLQVSALSLQPEVFSGMEHRVTVFAHEGAVGKIIKVRWECDGTSYPVGEGVLDASPPGGSWVRIPVPPEVAAMSWPTIRAECTIIETHPVPVLDDVDRGFLAYNSSSVWGVVLWHDEEPPS